MLATDRDALLCDMAQTYHVFDLKSLPPVLCATLAAGLPDDARIKMHMRDVKVSTNRLLLAAILDALNILVYHGTQDARAGINQPRSVVGILTGKEKSDGSGAVTAYDSPEAFLAARAELIRRRDNAD